MTQLDRTDALWSRTTLRAFAPLLHVAWSDGELTQEEIASVRQLTKGFALDDDDRAALSAWFDPDAHPTLAELARLKAHLTSAEAPEALEHPELGRLESALNITVPKAKPAPADASIGARALSEFLDGEERGLREELRAKLCAPPFVRRYGQSRSAAREQVLEWTRVMAAAGYGAAAYDENDPRGLAKFIAAFETAGHFDLSLSVKMGVQFGLFGGALQNLGGPQHLALADDVASLKLLGCFAMTERGHGSNVRELETTARWVEADAQFEIDTPSPSAHKDYIGNAACHATAAVVFAQLVTGDESHGVHAFLVPIRDDAGVACEGVRIEDCGEKMGLHGVDNGRLWFDKVRVPKSALLNRFGEIDDEGKYHSDIVSSSRRFFTMLGTLVGGRVSVANVAVAAAKSGLAIAIGYATQRRQFGPADGDEVTLMTYPTHQLRLLPRLAQVYAAHFATRSLVEGYITRTEENARQLESQAAGIKAFATRLCTDTLQDCRETCGGQGYLAANHIAALKNDSDVFATFEGDNVVLLQLVAKGVLTEFKEQFADDRAVSFVRYLARTSSVEWSATNPITARQHSEAHLRDANFHRDALAFREQSLTSSVSRRLRHRIGKGETGYDAFLACQVHLVRLARAHVEASVLASARAGIAKAPEPLRPLLDRVIDLFALTCLVDDLGWFCRQGVLEGDKASAVEREQEKLCAELAPHARALTAAFGIPDALLTPIATGDVTVRTS